MTDPIFAFMPVRSISRAELAELYSCPNWKVGTRRCNCKDCRASRRGKGDD